MDERLDRDPGAEKLSPAPRLAAFDSREPPLDD
jgi:hypothetical protein